MCVVFLFLCYVNYFKGTVLERDIGVMLVVVQSGPILISCLKPSRVYVSFAIETFLRMRVVCFQSIFLSFIIWFQNNTAEATTVVFWHVTQAEVTTIVLWHVTQAEVTTVVLWHVTQAEVTTVVLSHVTQAEVTTVVMSFNLTDCKVVLYIV